MRAERKEGLTYLEVIGGADVSHTGGDTALVLEGCGRGAVRCLQTVQVSGTHAGRMCGEARAEIMWWEDQERPG